MPKVSPEEMVEVDIKPCCGNPNLHANTGDILGFSIMSCYSCGFQMSGKSVEHARRKWNVAIQEKG